MTSELTDIILRVVERAPQWIRRDLDNKDAVARIPANSLACHDLVTECLSSGSRTMSPSERLRKKCLATMNERRSKRH